MVTLENISSTLALESIACIRVRARQCVISQRRHCNRVTFTVVFAHIRRSPPRGGRRSRSRSPRRCMIIPPPSIVGHSADLASLLLSSSRDRRSRSRSPLKDEMGRDIPRREEQGEEKLHVGNISRNVSEEHLKEIFSNFGASRPNTRPQCVFGSQTDFCGV